MEYKIIGIDVSKAFLDVAVCPSNRTMRAPNDESGCNELITFFNQLNPQLIVLEATGGLENLAFGMLTAAGFPVFMVNSRRVGEFDKATEHHRKSS